MNGVNDIWNAITHIVHQVQGLKVMCYVIMTKSKDLQNCDVITRRYYKYNNICMKGNLQINVDSVILLRWFL